MPPIFFSGILENTYFLFIYHHCTYFSNIFIIIYNPTIFVTY